MKLFSYLVPILSSILLTNASPGHSPICDVAGAAAQIEDHMAPAVAGSTARLQSTKATVRPGESIPLTLTVNANFIGLLLYANSPSKPTAKLGAFTIPANFRNNRPFCPTSESDNSVIAHQASQNYTPTQQFTYTAPAALTGDLIFHAIIIQKGTGNGYIYGVFPNVLTLKPESNNSPVAALVSSAATTSRSSSSSVASSSSLATPSSSATPSASPSSSLGLTGVGFSGRLPAQAAARVSPASPSSATSSQSASPSSLPSSSSSSSALTSSSSSALTSSSSSALASSSSSAITSSSATLSPSSSPTPLSVPEEPASPPTVAASVPASQTPPMAQQQAPTGTTPIPPSGCACNVPTVTIIRKCRRRVAAPAPVVAAPAPVSMGSAPVVAARAPVVVSSPRVQAGIPVTTFQGSAPMSNPNLPPLSIPVAGQQQPPIRSISVAQQPMTPQPAITQPQPITPERSSVLDPFFDRVTDSMGNK